jgi:UDP-N-acetyl-D-mannosaminuronate dehydrogenase
VEPQRSSNQTLQIVTQSTVFTTAQFDISKLNLTTCPVEVVQECDCIIIAVPSAYTLDALKAG